MSKLTLSLLGPFQATVAGQPVTDFATDKIRALLVYLAVEADQPHRRAALATLLWPNYSDAIALRNLRQSLHRLRHTLDSAATGLSDGLFTVTRQTVTLHSQALLLDTAVLQRQIDTVATHHHPALHSCEACLATLNATVATYRGEFLQGFLLPDAIAFDEWQSMCREQFHHQVAELLRRLTAAEEQRHHYGAMYDAARQLLAMEPWREEAHQWAMRALALNGQRSEALAQYERCCTLLAAELGVEPTAATTDLYEQIRRGELAEWNANQVTAVPATTPLLATRPSLAGFPLDHTKFLGRNAELAALTAYLTAPDTSLVTLIGPGGSGKTRLAVETAKSQLRDASCFADGIIFVPLATVTDAALLASTLAASLGLQLHESASHQEQLINYLRHKALLLVLDNFEQIVDGSDLLVAILAACATVNLLITSRVALNLRSEQRFTVRGLHYPTTAPDSPPAAPSPTALLAHSAVQLFIQAARQVQPGFTPDAPTLMAIAQICTLVEGLPLALELAATWVRLTDCTTIAQEIRNNLDFLTTSARDMPPRHRSMRAVFAHSWQHLSPAERRVLAQLATFAGGFTLDALLTVTDGTIVELANLLDWSLIQRADQQRYTLHELLRQFAEAELAAWPVERPDLGAHSTSALLVQTRRRHSDYYLALVLQESVAFYGEQPQNGLPRMRRDLDNIRAAWRWATDQSHFDLLASAGDGLATFFFLEGLLQEGEALFAAAVAQSELGMAQSTGKAGNPQPAEGRAMAADDVRSPPISEDDRVRPRVRSQLLVQQANFLSHQGKLMEAQPLLTKALTSLGDGEQAALAPVHNALGDLLRVKGEYERALVHLETALAYYGAADDSRGRASTLNNIGQLYWAKSAYAQALHYQQQALALERQLGHRLGIARCLSSMGLVYYRQSMYEQALACHRQAFVVAEALGNDHDMAKHLSNMGVVYYDQGEFAEATDYLGRALAIDRELGNRLGIAKRQTNLGMIYLRAGDYRQALASTQEAYQLLATMEHQSGIALTRGNMGVILFQMGEYQEALSHHEQALALDEALGNQDSVARHLGNIGATHANLGELTQALHDYDRALTLHRTLNTRYHWAQTLLRKAAALVQLDDYAAAADYQQEGLQMARAINRADAIFEGELLGAKLAQAQGEPAAAVAQLNQMLRAATSAYEQATLHDQLWQLQQEPFHAHRAVVLYQRLLEKSPSKEYRERVTELTQATHGAVAPAL